MADSSLAPRPSFPEAWRIVTEEVRGAFGYDGGLELDTVLGSLCRGGMTHVDLLDFSLRLGKRTGLPLKALITSREEALFRSAVDSDLVRSVSLRTIVFRLMYGPAQVPAAAAAKRQMKPSVVNQETSAPQAPVSVVQAIGIMSCLLSGAIRT